MRRVRIRRAGRLPLQTGKCRSLVVPRSQIPGPPPSNGVVNPCPSTVPRMRRRPFGDAVTVNVLVRQPARMVVVQANVFKVRDVCNGGVRRRVDGGRMQGRGLGRLGAGQVRRRTGNGGRRKSRHGIVGGRRIDRLPGKIDDITNTERPTVATQEGGHSDFQVEDLSSDPVYCCCRADERVDCIRSATPIDRCMQLNE